VGGKDHKLIVKMPGGAVFEQTVSIWGGESKKVRAEVKEAAAGVEGKPAAEEEPLPTEPEEAESEEPARIWTWVAYGVGGAAAVGAGVTIGLGYSKNSDVRDSCDDKECPSDLKDDAEQVESLALATDVLIGVAAIGIAAGTLLYFFEPEWMGDSDGDVQVAPAVSDGHAGVLIQGRF